MAGSWASKAAYPGAGQDGGISFAIVIDEKGYFGTGQGLAGLQKDFWQYAPVTNSWTQKADFGGTVKFHACGIAFGGKGYVGLGYDGASASKDWWEYNYTLNSWTQKTDFGGVIRENAFAFAIGNKGYVGCGTWTGQYVDVWEYDPIFNGDGWIQKADFPGSARNGFATFVIDSLGYVVCGFHPFVSPYFFKETWQYNPSTNSWVQKADFGGVARESARGFAINGKGYCGLGNPGYEPLPVDFWEYDPVGNSWTQDTDFPGAGRTIPAAFAEIAGKGYMGIGANPGPPEFYTDFYEFTPGAAPTPPWGDGFGSIGFLGGKIR